MALGTVTAGYGPDYTSYCARTANNDAFPIAALPFHWLGYRSSGKWEIVVLSEAALRVLDLGHRALPFKSASFEMV